MKKHTNATKMKNNLAKSAKNKYNYLNVTLTNPPTSLSVERVRLLAYEATYQQDTNHYSRIRHYVIRTAHHSQIGVQSAIQVSNTAKCENSLQNVRIPYL